MRFPLNNVVTYLKTNNKKMFEGLIWFHSPGHMVLEGDYISRVIKSNLTGLERPLLFIEEKAPAIFFKNALEYNNIPAEVIITPNAYKIQREIAVFYPELTIEGGVWSFKIPSNRKPRGENDLNFLYTRDYDDFLSFSRRAYRLRDSVPDINIYKNYFENKVLSETKNQELIEILSGKTFAVIQVKGVASNAVGALQTEGFYRKVLAYLRDLSLTPIIIGRDSPPAYFSEYNAIDYTRSKFVSYESDWILIGMSTIGLVHGSGLHNIFDILGKAYIFHDSWHHWPTKSQSCLFVPSFIQKGNSSSFLKFREFAQLARVGWDDARGAFVFPAHLDYRAHPSNPEYVISAISELMGRHSGDLELERLRIKSLIRTIDTDDFWTLTGTSMPVDFLKIIPDYFE
jgi:hypothetical protein